MRLFIALLSATVLAACGGGQDTTESQSSASSAFLSGDEDRLYMDGMRAWRDGNSATAETRFREALVANPRFLAATIALGDLLLSLGRAQEAVDAFDDALDLRATSVDANLGRARAMLDLGRFDEAHLSATTTVAYAEDNSMREIQAQGYTVSAHAQREMNDLHGAVDAFEAALALDAGTTDARVGLARLYAQLDEMADAVRVLGRAASYEEEPDQLLEVGRAFHDFEVYDPALDVLEIAYTGDPTNDDTLYYYASAAVRTGRHDLGNSLANELIGRSPDYSLAYLVRGEASLDRGYIDNAREDAQAVLARDPNNYDALILDGDVEAEDSNIEGAIARLQRAIELEPARLRAVEHLGRVLYAQRDWAGFVNLIEPLVSRSDRPESWLGMLVDAMDAAGMNEALIPYESELAYERGSDHELHHSVAERALQHPGALDPVRVHDHARLAIEHIGGAPLEYRLTLFDALLLVGRVDEARDTLDLAEQYYPNSSDVQERRDRL